jgi:hypothetical protein
MKRRPVETESFHADGRTDGQTDMMTLIVAFRDFVKTPKNDFERIQKEIMLYYIKQTTQHKNITYV